MDAYDMALVKTRCRDCTSSIPAVRTFDREVVRKAGCLRCVAEGRGWDAPEGGCGDFGERGEDVERPWEIWPNLSVGHGVPWRPAPLRVPRQAGGRALQVLPRLRLRDVGPEGRFQMTAPAWTGREPVEMERDGDGGWRCGNCWSPVSLRWRFCPDCGAEIYEPEHQTEQEQRGTDGRAVDRAVDFELGRRAGIE